MSQVAVGCYLLDLSTTHQPHAALVGEEGEAPMGQHPTELGVGDIEDVGSLTDRDPVRVGVSQMGAPGVVLEGDAFHLTRSDHVTPHESSSALKAAPEDPGRVEDGWLHDYAPSSRTPWSPPAQAT